MTRKMMVPVFSLALVSLVAGCGDIGGIGRGGGGSGGRQKGEGNAQAQAQLNTSGLSITSDGECAPSSQGTFGNLRRLSAAQKKQVYQTIKQVSELEGLASRADSVGMDPRPVGGAPAFDRLLTDSVAAGKCSGKLSFESGGAKTVLDGATCPVSYNHFQTHQSELPNNEIHFFSNTRFKVNASGIQGVSNTVGYEFVENELKRAESGANSKYPICYLKKGTLTLKDVGNVDFYVAFEMKVRNHGDETAEDLDPRHTRRGFRFPGFSAEIEYTRRTFSLHNVNDFTINGEAITEAELEDGGIITLNLE